MAQNVRSVVLVISAGLVAWGVALVIALLAGAESKILWTCVFGIVFGLIGLRYSTRRLRREKLT